ncbi:MAG TPA: hypothetical protein VFX33_13335 [Actinomycetales bacterium]|nr:hypothetical protein [Actinomycetales bacterium]
MKRMPRPLVLAAAAALSVAGLSGCMELSEQTTALQYAPSDGTQINVGGVKIANAILVSEGSGSPANLVATVANETRQNATVTISGEGLDARITVQGNDAVNIGPEGDQQVRVASLNARPGEMVNVQVDAGGQPQPFVIPVVDGTLPEYATLVPTPTATS